MSKAAKISAGLYIAGVAIVTACVTAKSTWLDGALCIGFAAIWAAWMVPIWPLK